MSVDMNADQTTIPLTSMNCSADRTILRLDVLTQTQCLCQATEMGWADDMYL